MAALGSPSSSWMGAFLMSSLNWGGGLSSLEALSSLALDLSNFLAHLQSRLSFGFGDGIDGRWGDGEALGVLLRLHRVRIFLICS